MFSRAVRPLLRMGHPVLRQKARAVEAGGGSSEYLTTLLREMRAAMHANDGAGLAAPQIGESVRVVVAGVEAAMSAPLPPMPVTAFVNPTVRRNAALERAAAKQAGGQAITMWESCLSVPGLVGKVLRRPAIEIAFDTEDGGRAVLQATGYYAGLMQHELDHLDGVLYVDKVAPGDLFFSDVFEQFMESAAAGRNAQCMWGEAVFAPA